MFTAEMEAKPAVDDVDGIDGVPEDDSEYEYEYPPEFIERLIKSTETMKLKIARGELKPMTVREAAAKHGVILD
jgi:hypothetical protein